MPSHVSRRALLAAGFAPWFRTLAAGAEASAPQRTRRVKSCILLWMPGGPTQHDTFDPGPGSMFGAADTTVPGLKFGEHLPHLARQAHRLALVRTMDTKDATHDSAIFLMSSGYKKNAGGVRHPHLGAAVAHEFADPAAELPAFVALANDHQHQPSTQLCTPGYLGAKFAPLVTLPGRGIPDLTPPDGHPAAATADRVALLDRISREFTAGRPATAAAAHATTLDATQRLMRSTRLQAFDLSREPERVQDRYGRTDFGRQCLQARRLVEAGVPFVQAACAPVESFGQGRSGWDAHTDTERVTRDVLLPALDRPMAALLDDLRDRGLLDSTLVIWAGEFGRGRQGVAHNSKNWSTALAGGGVRGGVAVGGSTRPDSFRPVGVADFFATVFTALGIDPAGEHVLRGDRPMSVVDGGRTARPVAEVLA